MRLRLLDRDVASASHCRRRGPDQVEARSGQSADRGDTDLRAGAGPPATPGVAGAHRRVSGGRPAPSRLPDADRPRAPGRAAGAPRAELRRTAASTGPSGTSAQARPGGRARSRPGTPCRAGGGWPGRRRGRRPRPTRPPSPPRGQPARGQPRRRRRGLRGTRSRRATGRRSAGGTAGTSSSWSTGSGPRTSMPAARGRAARSTGWPSCRS